MLRETLLRLSERESMRQRVRHIASASEVVDRFVAGESLNEVLHIGNDLISKGLKISVDHLCPSATTAAEAESSAHMVASVIQAVGSQQVGATAEVSITLSTLGLGLSGGDELALNHARALCEKAATARTLVTINMEEPERVQPTLEVYNELRKTFPTTGIALQSMLRRSEQDCAALAEKDTRVRLCKGMYTASHFDAYDHDYDVDRNYVRCLRMLFEAGAYPMVATHDPRIVPIAAALAKTNDYTPTDYEYQMLFGVRPFEQRRLVDIGRQVRVYLPFGAQWHEYFARRIAERPATLAFFARQMLSRR